MNKLKRLAVLLKKDFLLEWRQKYSLYGLMLYLLSAVFAINTLHENPENETWNALVWLILLFVSVNAVAKSFLQEHRNRFIYYYTVHHPQDVILSKVIYNLILMLIMSLISFVLFYGILGQPQIQLLPYLLIVLSGGASMSILFTMLSAIASKAGGNSALIAILGFPLVIPQLILLSDISRPLVITLEVSGWWTFVGILFILDAIILAMSLLLFPYLWKE
ncbi:MAG: heme exporter protein CcmB [Chitinophagaceae bacterium]|nr:heme exporter protein CcmB [Chitinophagaceae bacterium]